MNFLKSIISDDPEPPTSESDPDSPGGASNPTDGDDADAWSFGGFVRSFSMQSESVIESYRRDLQEFGSGLKKETDILRETASRAVKDLPASLEAAQGAIDVVLKSINKETLGFASDGEEAAPPGANLGLKSNSGRYSRFEAQLSAIRSDLNTFVVEPEDKGDYGDWKLGFELGDYEDAIEGLIGGIGGDLGGVYAKAVPDLVDSETFWCRYFYRVEKLKQQEKMRASIVKMAIANEDEEELSWDVDEDDDDDDGDDGKSKGGNEAVDNEKGNVVGVDNGTVDEKDGNDEKVVVVSNRVEEMGWDEIGDVGSGDETKASAVGSSSKDEVRKRLAVDDDEEDLNWGDEDDDEPVKA